MSLRNKFVSMFSAFILGFLLILLLLPSEWSAKQSIEIKKEATIIFPVINQLDRWRDWHHKITPEPSYAYEGEKEGIGAILIWKKQNQNGVLRIVDSKPHNSIYYEESRNYWSHPFFGSVFLKPSFAGTEITWIIQGKSNHNPINKYRSYIIQRKISKDLKISLNELKNMIER